MSEEATMGWLRRNKNEEAMHDETNPAPTPPHDITGEPAVPAPASTPESTDPVNVEEVRESVIETLRTIFDPEIPVNIYEIGLIYGLEVEPSGRVNVRMTLTSPMCPVAETLPPEVETKINAVPGVREVVLDVVWDPPWNPQMMSDDAKLLLGIS
jgi:FeS assembly SUF system protein